MVVGIVSAAGILFLAACSMVEAGVSPTRPYCFGSTLHELRIQGCNEQPCTIRKGERLPFEIDLSFEKEVELADRFDFHVFNPYYSVPPAAYGDKISRADCDDGKLGFSCPVYPNVKYTLKSEMYIDPRAECTAGCHNANERKTQWQWSISNSQVKDSSSSCNFQITMNIAE